ncbi:MAG: nitronate monooxygenase family protein [Pseudomonadales bacterium]|nr:nitronate monooxygenase family protein [Pseudomonadales bacterium]
MKSPICELLGIEFPLIAFTHCRDVVCEVSKAGGMGVLGAASFTAEQLEVELQWIDEHIDGMPYGVDLIVPTSMAVKDGSATPADIKSMIPDHLKEFSADILKQHDIHTDDVYKHSLGKGKGAGFLGEGSATNILDIAFSHPIKLIANALGVPPKYMLELGKKHGVPVAALIGSKQHAIKQAEAGVDILVAAGTEAGGHCGEVSTMVLIPEVYNAVKDYPDVCILGAGGIVTGSQMAASMAMGADGVWTASVWLTTQESETSAVIKEKLLAANSNQTVRSKSRTGKFSRQIRSPWTDAWELEGAPRPLPMPLQSLVSEPALREVSRLADIGHEGAKTLATYWVGQGVGLMNQSLAAKQVVVDFMEDYLAANERLNRSLEDS